MPITIETLHELHCYLAKQVQEIKDRVETLSKPPAAPTDSAAINYIRALHDRERVRYHGMRMREEAKRRKESMSCAECKHKSVCGICMREGKLKCRRQQPDLFEKRDDA